VTQVDKLVGERGVQIVDLLEEREGGGAPAKKRSPEVLLGAGEEKSGGIKLRPGFKDLF